MDFSLKGECMQLWIATLCFFFSFLAYGQVPLPMTDSETAVVDAALEKTITKPDKDEKILDEEILKPLPDIKEVSELSQLTQFEDVAVIQKRFLPKTSRVEIFPNVGFIINDSFFTNTAFSGRVAYYFSESYGLEINGMILGTSERKVTSDLNQVRGVVTRSLVSPQSYYGLDFKWSPVYGKVASLDKSIVPFDMYFNIGGGMMKTNQGTNPTAIHFGTGQAFALSKWSAFRWDISWYWYNTTSATGASGSFTNIFAMIGMSFFVPEASYR